jgi:hypothetical protein
MGGDGRADGPSLTEFITEERWQRLQDHFAAVLGLGLRTVSASHGLLTAASWPPGADAERMVQLLAIGDELDRLLPPGEPPRQPTSTVTPLGVSYASVPIRSAGELIIAYLVVGPLIVGAREDELAFGRRAASLGLEAKALWPVLLSLRLYTFTGIRAVMVLLEEVGRALAELGYSAQQLSAILPSAGRVDQAVVAYYTDRVLDSLLHAATLATRADGGSVMLYDEARERLRIRAAQGLSEEVVSSAALKPGEGLAGLAAQQNRILLLDRETADPELAARMHRPELASSLVAPLKADRERHPFGVLSLRSKDPTRPFTQEHVELLRSLLDLAAAALSSLRLVFGRPHAPRKSPA